MVDSRRQETTEKTVPLLNDHSNCCKIWRCGERTDVPLIQITQQHPQYLLRETDNKIYNPGQKGWDN